MAQFFIYFKTELKIFLKQAPQVVGVFLFLPFFFSALMGFSFTTAFVPELSLDPILVHIQNKDQGEKGGLILEAFESDELREYFDLVEREEADFEVTIHSDYSETLEDTRIRVEAKMNTSSTERAVLINFLTEWQQMLVNQETQITELETVRDPQVAANLQASLEKVSTIEGDRLFNEQKYDSNQALTSNQFSSVTGVIYLLFLTLSTGVTMNTNRDFKGLKKRLGVLPLTPTQSVLYDLATNTILYSTLVAMFLGIWRLYDSNTFIGNPFFYLFWIIIYTLFFQALNITLQYLIPGKLSGVFYQVALMVYMIFGFLPLDQMVGGEFKTLYSQNFIRQLFNQPIYNHMLNRPLFSDTSVAVGLLLVTVLLTSVTIIMRNRRELSPA